MRGLHLQDVTIQDNIKNGWPAGSQAVALAAGPPPAVAFADPPMMVWLSPKGPEIRTEPFLNIRTFPTSFLEGGAVLAGIKHVRCSCPEPASSCRYHCTRQSPCRT